MRYDCRGCCVTARRAAVLSLSSSVFLAPLILTTSLSLSCETPHRRTSTFLVRLCPLTVLQLRICGQEDSPYTLAYTRATARHLEEPRRVLLLDSSLPPVLHTIPSITILCERYYVWLF
ncbi:hypothetical protein EDB83DRAFT_647760 [Lactarius deliciosus]|nr:hypothetical protein EDB83DRAFT_647760 [Lactarius deliciosus]